MRTYILTKDNNFWKACVRGRRVTYSWGIVGGIVQTNVVDYDKGKNTGRVNETSPEEQCLFEAEVKARKKIEKGYVLEQGYFKTMSDTVVTSNLEVPLPMLANRFEKAHIDRVLSQSYVDIQPKLDGNRCLINRNTGEVYSRSRKLIHHLRQIGVRVIRACQSLPKYIYWLDGELFSPDMTFNEIQSVIRSAKNLKPDMIQKIRFHMFDVISDDKWDNRAEYLRLVGDSVDVLESKCIEPTLTRLKEFHDMYVKKGYEGLIIRLLNFPYENKRSLGLIKYKMFDDEEFKVVGFKCEKHDSTKLGAAICVMKSGKTFDPTPAMSDKEKADIWSNQKKYIGKIATVKFQGYDVKTGIPRFPILKCFRDKGDL
jgi:DNA ligase-1